MNDFQKLDVYALRDNPFKLLAQDWMLVTAGPPDHFNTMTASWGSLGVLWNKPVAFIFIRPQRHTLAFVADNADFTLTFFDEKYRTALQFCGSRSGRDYDKPAETGLSPIITPRGNTSFYQARMFMECRKLYSGKLLEEAFNDRELIPEIYPNKDFHHLFIGEITDCYGQKK